MQLWRRFLLPFSLLYGCGVYIRNFLFDKKKLKSESFRVPLISVGNITTGGTGKTPHVEYLIEILRKKYRTATLSRGYGRSSKGYIEAALPGNTHEIGDEPMQYLTKYADITVFVSEDRVEGIQRILDKKDAAEVIIMDDAFQHRKVIPGMNILLVEYDSVFKEKLLLPAGNLREPFSSRKRADIIIITKSPSILVSMERKRILEEIKPLENQQVFFSFIRYGEFNKVFGPQNSLQLSADYYLEKRFTILLITGIADPSGLIEYLRRHTNKLEMLIFPDHHEFTQKDIQKIQERFDNIANPSKIIVTTEKDAMRLRNPDITPSIAKLPIFFLPITVHIHQEEERFNNFILEYVRKTKANN